MPFAFAFAFACTYICISLVHQEVISKKPDRGDRWRDRGNSFLDRSNYCARVSSSTLSLEQ